MARGRTRNATRGRAGWVQIRELDEDSDARGPVRPTNKPAGPAVGPGQTTAEPQAAQPAQVVPTPQVVNDPALLQILVAMQATLQQLVQNQAAPQPQVQNQQVPVQPQVVPEPEVQYEPQMDQPGEQHEPQMDQPGEQYEPQAQQPDIQYKPYIQQPDMHYGPQMQQPGMQYGPYVQQRGVEQARPQYGKLPLQPSKLVKEGKQTGCVHFPGVKYWP